MSFNYSQPPTPQRPLHYWLESEVAKLSPQHTPSALREMAWRFGQWRGFAAACAGIGVVGLGIAWLLAVWRPQIIWLWALLIVAALLLMVLCPLISKLKISKIASGKSPMLSRAAASISAGVGAAIFLSAIFVALASFALDPWFHMGAKGITCAAAVYALILILMTSVFVLPGYFAHYARRDFRRHIDQSPSLRTQLEHMSQTWVDPVGNQSFGPL
ncbi:MULTISPECIES: hypothetical protein [Arthrobacter]|uniref:Uncharacterized protein n=1 Tax=Arthrobacter psychrochitiniphilus TaxID=291045 RepID=A0A2V3DW76_9MICC|nr:MULTISPECIES: hypothetical protein [Arthrobacter]NYG16797.1 FtsH-binding integral membrane protein [Arthrobacter psychrochitiniphilus]PXA69115.1 hypothetical protein CVS29_00585 [Arthrobacter psychrochitiniphilus]